jgi:hypothetical protein
MLPLLLLALVVWAGGDSVAGPPPELSPRPIHHETTRISWDGLVVTTEGDSVASMKVVLEVDKRPHGDAYAEYMSAGPWVHASDTSSRTGFPPPPSGPVAHRLRVTFSTYENAHALTIDEIIVDRRYHQQVKAAYSIYPFFDIRTQALREALRRAPRVPGPVESGPRITWLAPTIFAMVTRVDTLVFEQKADSIFQVTIRARVR